MSRLVQAVLFPSILLAALAVLGSAEAATTIPGQTISSNETWTLAGSPYVVTGGVTVAGAAVPVLSIEPGVEVRFGTFGSLQVGSGSSRGVLVANGTEADPILFTSAAANKSRGDWNHLRFDTLSSSPRSYVNNATVEWGGRNSRTSIEIVEGPVTLANVTVRQSAWAGVYVDNVAPVLRDVALEDNARWGLYAEADGEPALERVAIRRTGNVPLRVRLDQDLSGVTLEDDAVRRVERWGIDVTSDLTLPALVDALGGQRYDDVLLSGFTVRNGAVWTILPGANVLVADAVSLGVGGYGVKASLRAEGTQAEPISFGSLSGSSTNGWYGLHFRADGGAGPGESVLRNATVSGSRDEALNVYHYGGLLLDNVTLERNAQRGLFLQSSDPSFRNLVVRDHGWEAMYLVSSSPVWRGGHVNGTGRSGIHAAGCGVATLEDVVIERTASYGFYGDNPCAGAHLDGVDFVDLASRPWRNRLDVRHGVDLLEGVGLREVEYWGNDLQANATLPLWQDETGTDLASVVLSGFTVRGGATWTIPPRSRVLWGDGAALNVGSWQQGGNLVAEGTQAEPITFASRSGGVTNGWFGAYFRGDGGAPLGHSVLRNVTLSGSRDDAIETYAYAGLLLDNVTTERNALRGVHLQASSIQMRNLHSHDNGWENLVYVGSSPVLRGGVLERSGRSGVYAAGCGVATFENVTIRDSASYGFYSNDGCAGAHFDGVRIENVTGRPWRNRLDVRIDATYEKAGVDEVEHWGNDLLASRSPPVLVDPHDGAKAATVLLTGFGVRGGAVLSFPAGSRVLFGDGAFINVGAWQQQGSLVAEGTQAEPVVFASRSGSTAGGWYGIHFRGDGGAPLGHSVLRNATLSHSRDDAIDAYAYNGLTLDNVTLADNGRYGLRLDGSSPSMRNVDALRSGWEGAYMHASSPTWRGGRIADTQRSGLYTSGCAMPVLEGVLIENARGYGHFADGACNGAHYDGVAIRNVTSRPWRNRLDARFGVSVDNATVAEVEYWGADLTASRTLWTWTDGVTGARFASVVLTGFDIRNGAAWTIPAGTRVLWGDASYVNVGGYGQKGSLVAEGTEAEPITLTSRSGGAANGWYGAYFRGDGGAGLGESVLRNATISFSRDDAIDAYRYQGLTLDNLTLDANARYGVRLDGSSLTLRSVDVSRAGWESGVWINANPTWIDSRLNDSGRSGLYTTGCGMGRLVNVTIESPNGYGHFADGACNGAHYDGVTILDASSRPFRNRLDARDDVTIRNATVDEAEWWGADLVADRTLRVHVDQLDGARLPHVILSGVEVRGGAVWTIPAGSRALFGDGSWVNVGAYAQQGSLVVDGTEADPVHMGSRSGSTAGGWYGIYFRGDGSAPLGGSALRNVTIAFSRDDGAEVYAYNGLLLDNVTFDRNARHGVYVNSASPALRNVDVVRSGSDGALLVNANPAWHGGRVERAGRHGFSSSGCGVATLVDVVVDTPASYGFRSDGPCNGAHLDGVHFVNLTTFPWRNRLDLRDAATVENASVLAVEYWGNDLSGNRTLASVANGAGGERLDARLLGSFVVRNGATLTIPAGARVLGGDHVSLQVGTCAQQGSLRVEGTAEEPVYMGSLSGSTAGGWSGLHFRGDCGAARGASVVRNATIAFARDHGLDLYHYGGLALDNVTVRQSGGHGIRIQGNAAGTPSLDAVWSTRNGGNGLWIESEGASVARSNLSDNALNGLELRNTAGVTLRDSTLFNNTRSGANVTWHPADLDARRNSFWRNGGYGVDLQAATGNVVVDNAFIQNLAGQARATGLNTWNATRTEGRNVAHGPFLGGNSWSDYMGEDTDGDGLGDTLLPYATNLGPGRDWLPVMGNLYADFDVAIPDPESLPRRLVFTDTSRGGFSPADRWTWDFGDGSQADTAEATHEFAADGAYPVRLVVTNAHGQAAQIARIVVVDSVLPLSEATVDGTPGLDGWHVSGVNVTLSATDDSAGVQRILYRLDGGAWTTYATPISVLADGPHVLEHYAVDRNGNQETPRDVAFRIDRTAPALAEPILNGTAGNAPWYAGDVLVGLAASDATSGLARIDYAWNATPNETYAEPLSVTQDGVHLLRWRAVDQAGNVGPERELAVRRDATRPWIEGHESGPLGGAGWYVGPVTVNLTGGDATSGLRHLNASVDSGPWFEVAGPFEVEGPGAHTVNVTATDAAGNVLDAPARTIRIDLATPASEHHVNATLGSTGWLVLEANGTDPVGGVPTAAPAELPRDGPRHDGEVAVAAGEGLLPPDSTDAACLLPRGREEEASADLRTCGLLA